MTALIILASIYLVSIFTVWKWMQIAYSEGGRWEYLEVDGMDVFLTLCPFVNTVGVVYLWGFTSAKEIEKPNWDYGKFFRVKK